jgi:hypothetical protein
MTNDRYLIHLEHPPSGPEACASGNRSQASRWITFRVANGSLSEWRAQSLARRLTAREPLRPEHISGRRTARAMRRSGPNGQKAARARGSGVGAKELGGLGRR